MPESPDDPRRFGHSRDRRSDCVLVIVALVVTPEGLPLAYEIYPPQEDVARQHRRCITWSARPRDG